MISRRRGCRERQRRHRHRSPLLRSWSRGITGNYSCRSRSSLGSAIGVRGNLISIYKTLGSQVAAPGPQRRPRNPLWAPLDLRPNPGRSPLLRSLEGFQLQWFDSASYVPFLRNSPPSLFAFSCLPYFLTSLTRIYIKYNIFEDYLSLHDSIMPW
jgi:hypothetical protein